jgi:hypothetical protein
MASPFGLRGFLIVGAGLCGGVALGVLLPREGGGALKDREATARAAEETLARAASGGASAADPGEGGVKKELLGLGADTNTQISEMSQERIIALFEKLSNLKSESRKYVLAYRLASKMGASQIEGALQAALQDLSDGDYVTTRALARRWVELDPKKAASKALESKQQHLVVPVMEAWSRMDPAGPLDWALKQQEATRADAVRPLLMGRLLDQPQLEKLVMNAGSSENDEMRKQVFPFATARLAESNPAGALHAASGMDDPELAQRTVMMVLGRLGQNDRAAGLTWINGQSNLSPEVKQQYEQALASPRGFGRPPRSER